MRCFEADAWELWAATGPTRAEEIVVKGPEAETVETT